MKRAIRSSFLVALGVFIGVSLAGVTVHAQRQGGPPGGGRGGGGFGGFNPQTIVQRALHGSWALISFDLDTTDEQLVDLRKVYQKSVEDTKAKFAEMGEIDPNNRREAMQGLMQGQQELLAAVKTHLDEEQTAKLEDWYKEQAEQAQRGGGRGGRTRPEGGGGGGARRQRDN